MKRTIFCVALILCMAIMAGCAAQASGKTQTPISAKTELTSAQKADDTAEVATALLPSQTVEENSKTEDSADTPLPVERAETLENADAEAENQPTAAETAPPTIPEQAAIPAPVPEDTPVPAPTPAPAQKPAEKQEGKPAPTPEPAPAPKPAASGNIYSIAEAVRAGNEYARAQYGVTIDTSMTAANSSYFPGTADSVAWLAENGGQAALTAAVKGNVDATFACLAAMDGAETVSVYARFNCTVRYDAASDEYIVVVLYG
jgi:outer membrane biosynthesis protein TonB